MPTYRHNIGGKGKNSNLIVESLSGEKLFYVSTKSKAIERELRGFYKSYLVHSNTGSVTSWSSSSENSSTKLGFGKDYEDIIKYYDSLNNIPFSIDTHLFNIHCQRQAFENKMNLMRGVGGDKFILLNQQFRKNVLKRMELKIAQQENLRVCCRIEAGNAVDRRIKISRPTLPSLKKKRLNKNFRMQHRIKHKKKFTDANDKTGMQRLSSKPTNFALDEMQVGTKPTSLDSNTISKTIDLQSYELSSETQSSKGHPKPNDLQSDTTLLKLTDLQSDTMPPKPTDLKLDEMSSNQSDLQSDKEPSKAIDLQSDLTPSKSTDLLSDKAPLKQASLKLAEMPLEPTHLQSDKELAKPIDSQSDTTKPNDLQLDKASLKLTDLEADKATSKPADLQSDSIPAKLTIVQSEKKILRPLPLETVSPKPPVLQLKQFPETWDITFSTFNECGKINGHAADMYREGQNYIFGTLSGEIYYIRKIRKRT